MISFWGQSEGLLEGGGREKYKDLDQWNLEQENSRPGDSMSKGSEAEVTRLQVENQRMVQFDHI